MQLQTKLLVAMSSALSVIFLLVGLVNHRNAEKNTYKDLLNQAEKVRGVLMSTRRVYHKQFIQSDVELTEKTLGFLPAFALNLISADYASNWDKSGFTFNNISDRPRNPRQQADANELEIMKFFRENPKEELVFKKVRNENGEEIYLYARPIWVEEYCLKCHGEYEKAPQAIRNLYTNSYDYKVGDLRGLLSIKLPTDAANKHTQNHFYEVITIEFIGFISFLILIILILRKNITCPLTEITQNMQMVARGNYSQRVQSTQCTEFKILSDVFNHMTEQVEKERGALQKLNTELEELVSKRTAKLYEQNEELKLLNQEKNEFLEIVSHDLKNPLSNIYNLSEILLESSTTISSKEIADHSQDIFRESKKMFQLIINLLDVNAIESGKINLNLETIDLLPIVEKVITNYVARAQKKAISIYFKCAEKKLLVWTDKMIAEQVLDNLISNAIKYSPLGKNVTVKITKTEQSICCDIEDQGQGLSEQDQQKLFGKFSRLSTKPTADEHSTGLGLFIVKKLVTALNGKVWCTSQLGSGSTFSVAFPTVD